MAKTITRVEFYTTPFQLASGRYVGVLRDIFGNRAAKYANCAEGLWIECSPTDFIKFQIARDKAGIANSWKCFKTRIFAVQVADDPQPAREIFW